MTTRLLPFELRNSAGTLTSSDQISVDDSTFTNIATSVSNTQQGFSEVNTLAGVVAANKSETDDSVGVLQQEVATLQNTAFNSGRSFLRFNDGFTIDDTNLATFEDKNIIYTARNDKALDGATRPDVNLPTEDQIATSGESYPITFEFTHLGGSGVFTDRNVVRFFLEGTQIGSILRDQVTVITKEGVGQDYEFSSGTFDPNDTILPTGIFNLKVDTPISNATTTTTELAGVTIVAGDAYLVETGGDWGQYSGDSTIPSGSILVALVNNASLVDEVVNEDWLLLDNPRVNSKQAAFLDNFVQDGIRFNGSRNVQVDPANVAETTSGATGLPLTRQVLIGGSSSGNTARSLRYNDQPVQFADIVGGQMTLSISFSTINSSGSLPELIDFVIELDNKSFTFPLTGISVDSGAALVTIDIPSDDYTTSINTNANLVLNYQFRGASYNGSYTINGWVNNTKGRLNDAVRFIAQQEASLAESRVDAKIGSLAEDIDNDGASLQSIQQRISPYKEVTQVFPDSEALFLDSTGSDTFPAALTDLTQVSVDNPRFTGGDIALYVATVAGASYTLNNITQDTSTPLQDSEVTVDLGESLTDGTNTYFVYRVTGLISGDVYEVDRITSERVVAWPDDINNLEDDISRIDAELEHGILNLPDAIVHVLENQVEVTEETTPTIIATDYNKQLAGSSNTSQTVFYEPSPNTPGSGVTTSKPISDLSGDQVRRKLLYFPAGTTYTNSTYLSAFDGATSRDLIEYVNGVFNAKVFVPAIPSGSTVDTIYPAQPTRVSGAGIWQTVPTLTTQSGFPVPEADEVFFTRNIPTSTTTLNIAYRGHSNGNIFGTSSTTLTGVGGGSEVSTTFTLDDGGEIATVEVLWRASSREIRVSVTESVRTGLPTIDDIQVILSFSQTRVVPSTPATVRKVPLEFEHPQGQVFAIKPSTTDTLVLVGDRTEVDTGYAYTTLFGGSEGGHLVATGEGNTFLNYKDFDPISSTITDLENHATLPQFGLFSTKYTHSTIVDLDTQLTVRNSQGDVVNVGEGTILVATDNSRWRLEVNTVGALSTTQVV